MAISIDEARRIVMSAVHPLETEAVALLDALGRVLAAPVLAAGDAPPFDSSAMDGYAIRSGPAGRELRVSLESRAGAPAVQPLGDGEAARVSTGATIPAGADAVVRQEDTEPAPDGVVVLVDVPPGNDIRRAGEDMRAGTRVLAAGVRLGPTALASAVAAGAGAVTVTRQPVVRILCTGDELRPPGSTLGPGQIHDSNGLMIQSLVRTAGALAPPARRVADSGADTDAAVAGALADADVLLVCGGISVGPHDHVKPALERHGVRERFWRVALRPGGPVWFGVSGRRLVFGLPGNPVSAAVTFALFVRPALAALSRERERPARPSRARLAEDVMRNPGREQAIRVRLEERGDGFVAHPTGPQGSHITTSLVEADALGLIPRGEGRLPAGSEIRLAPAPG